MLSKSGISASSVDGKNVVRFNGSKVNESFVRVGNRFGVRIFGDYLVYDSKMLMASSASQPALSQKDDVVYFGGSVYASNACTNITLENYNKILKGENTDAAKFETFRIYNIVENPSASPLITYVDNGDTITFNTGITARKTYAMIYNSIAGTLPENTEDFDATVMGDCPFVNLRYFNPIVKTGDGLLLEYFVDNKNMDSLNNATIGDTFTTIIKLANGTEYKKTTYAGFQYIDLPAFNTVGETLFSVRCIDQNGVSSVEQFFDFLVRDEVVKNYYTMADADLGKYGIVPDNDDIQIATANKAALTAFFAAVKDGGYNGVVLLERTYWLDYHGEPISFPDGFTVDLNGATLAATQCVDLNSGNIIRLDGNFDTHIINGNIVGNYNGFDFAATKANTGVNTVAEGLNATRVSKGSRYCSLEGLDISYTVGYEFTTDGVYGGFDYLDIESKGIDGKRIDLLSGEETDEAGCVVTSYIGLKNASKIAVGRSGQGSYQGGTRRELLFSFYDTNKSYISTVKTKMYYEVKVPSGAVYVRITGYGTKAQWPLYGGSGVLGVNRNPEYPTNIKVKSCSWHDTRTCAFTLGGCNGFRVEGCHWTNIALETGTYQVTKILGDFEDGWQRTRNVFIHDCIAVTGNGMNNVSMTYCNKLEMTGCIGFSVTSSGIEDGLIADNVFSTLTIGRDYRSMNPHVAYLRNTITTLSVNYSDGSGNTYNSGHVDKTVPMFDSVIKNVCSYSDLLLRNSQNGVMLID